MSHHSDDYLPDYVLGLLDGPARTSLEEHLSECPRCLARLAELGGSLAPSPDGERSNPPPVGVPAKLKLVAAPMGSRLEAYATQVSRLFDLRIHRAVALLELVDDPNCWLPGPAQGIDLFPVDAGPRLEGAITSIMRVAPGCRVPFHEHCGEEQMLMLQGGLRDGGGRELRRGEISTQPLGSGHWLVALPGEECICCVAAMGGTLDEDGAD